MVRVRVEDRPVGRRGGREVPGVEVVAGLGDRRVDLLLLGLPSPPPSLPAVAASRESIHRRNCSGGCPPWKLASGCPPASATTVGTASMPNICASRGTTSTLTVANDHFPASASASPQRVGQLDAGLAAGRPQQHHHRNLAGPDQHLGFEVGLGQLDSGAPPPPGRRSGWRAA